MIASARCAKMPGRTTAVVHPPKLDTQGLEIPDDTQAQADTSRALCQPNLLHERAVLAFRKAVDKVGFSQRRKEGAASLIWCKSLCV